MNLRLYDTARREKRDFVPADPARVTMYVCGPTVYGYAHIGNFRPVVAFDVLFRMLRHVYGEDAVLYARNVTDVDDKINAKAEAEGVPISVITDRYFAAYLEDADALGALRPTFQPEATAYIQQMVDAIADLIRRGGAYEAEGHVLFDTQAASDYGSLSGRSLDDMIAGARVEVAPYKRHPADFVLWKPSKPGEPSWPSPWGDGRPGWHSECSTMIDSVLGGTIDIHGGGIDLVFPHHENELAQARSAHDGAPLANYWMHNGFLDMAGEKMSKSLGNVVVPHDLLKAIPGEVIRWALLSAQYRKPLDWSEDLIEQAWSNLDRLYSLLRRYRPEFGEGVVDEAVLAALYDDLNTPKAMAALFALAKGVETGPKDARRRLAANLWKSAGLLGFLAGDPEAWFQEAPMGLSKHQIWNLMRQRDSARRSGDWTESDFIKDFLQKHWVRVEDGPERSTWSAVRDPELFRGLARDWMDKRYTSVSDVSESKFADYMAHRGNGLVLIEVASSIQSFARRISSWESQSLFEEWTNSSSNLLYVIVVPSQDFRKRDAQKVAGFFSRNSIAAQVVALDGSGEVFDLHSAAPGNP